MEELLIEGFDGVYALCEQKDKQKTTVPKYRLPLETQIGDCVFLNRDGMYVRKEDFLRDTAGIRRHFRILFKRTI